jgi:glycosyltransferase involved in cell wall biosynthesis
MNATHAAFTLVSKNYFALATTLAASYRRHHPQNDFIIVLVDKADGYVPALLPSGAQVIELAQFAIPDIGRFIYRYTIMELNTAVKPFVLADLFERRGYETLLYLDPDIWIRGPLAQIYGALEEASIVLTPHMRKPYWDAHIPSDLTILQSGTYNLGFIGLRRGDSARALLEWWMSKLYRDCVVDIPKGLFVDQKWVDLVPGFFPDHRILYDPTCNVAYWNLHERRLTQAGGEWRVDGAPLTFFHFSGYLPFVPQSLSKHQDRFALDRMPALKALTDAYADTLMANGYAESSAWPYAFDTLPNGVRLPLNLVRHVMQWASRAGVATPCPIADADGFCRFLMARDVLPGRPRSVLLLDFLLRTRGDVAAAFPGAMQDSDDLGFRNWVRTSGVREYEIQDVLPFEHAGAVTDYVADAFERLRSADRRDIFDRFPKMWSEQKSFEDFAHWFGAHGVKQMRFERAHSDRLKRALPGISRILNLYFLRGDLQARYPALGDRSQAIELANWLREHRYELDLAQEEISLFLEFALASRDLLEKMRFLYQHRGKPSRIARDIFEIDARQREIGGLLANGEIAEFLAEDGSMDPADHYFARFGPDTEALGDFARCSVEGLDSRKNFEFVRRMRQSVQARGDGGVRINNAGFFTAPSGMGESARSLRATLAHTQAKVREVALPHPQASPEALLDGPAIFGWPFGGADVSIAVANADSASLVESFLPRNYWARRNVGYWVWETEELPSRFKDSERLFDEVWAPSRFSADAIARTIDRPVHVLPHTLDFAALDKARANRPRYGLPEDGVLFGFAFEPASVLERKNVRGLIQAFREAFRDDDQCYLVLKVNGRTQGNFEYEMIRAMGDSKRILFLEATLARVETFGFMKSLDAYVSLHRAEGFGLTCAEAMALAMPVVASGYSGNLEFMNDGNSLLVPTAVIETQRPHGAYPAGSRWGDPDLEAAASLMRSLKDADRRTELGERAAASIRERLDARALGARARELIAQLAGRSDVQRK